MNTITAHDEDGQIVVHEEIEGHVAALTRLIELKAEAAERGYFFVHGENEYGFDLDEPLCR